MSDNLAVLLFSLPPMGLAVTKIIGKQIFNFDITMAALRLSLISIMVIGGILVFRFYQASEALDVPLSLWDYSTALCFDSIQSTGLARTRKRRIASLSPECLGFLLSFFCFFWVAVSCGFLFMPGCRLTG